MRDSWLGVRQTMRLLRSEPRLWVPFLVAAFGETILVGLIWLAPQDPFSSVLAPPVRYVFGERVLHYPWHLWFLYHGMKYTHLLTSLVIGFYTSGVACEMVRQAHAGAPCSVRAALISGRVAYGPLFLLGLLSCGLAWGATGLISRLMPVGAAGNWAGVALTVMLQALIVYAIPAAVFDKVGAWAALIRGVREVARHPLSTLVVVAIASGVVLSLTLSVTPGRLARWMVRTTPEIAVAFSAARLVLWTAVDAFLTVAAAQLWWIHRPLHGHADQRHGTLAQRFSWLVSRGHASAQRAQPTSSEWRQTQPPQSQDRDRLKRPALA